MRVLRSVVAVVVGYLLFASCAFAFFQVSGQAPHQDASASIMFGSIAVGVIAAGLGGFLAAWMAGRRPLAHGVAVGVLLALGAAVSLLATLGHGAIWSQLAALLLMAPAAVLGGWVRARPSRVA